MLKHLRKFLDHFDNNVMEYPKSWWRKAWGWTPLYWLRCMTFTKYHIVDFRNDYSDPAPYRWGWVDRDRALLYASFKILVEFMELEKPAEIIDWESDPEHSRVWKEMNALYTWWKVERKQEHIALDSLLDDLPHRPFDEMFVPVETESGYKAYQYVPEPPEVHQVYEVYRQHEELLEAKDQEMLHRLIDIRKSLWT